ncbi:hypothetical protein AXF42_Ash001009 [Apostasia shenzhenica]|uniref:Uncharacterized protein n=1 Tax=Apostasia shenzhenica TaxID=1088818 RepID=A0A2I0ATS6_9ASPA|nr:hypothetical protein AXF42_Ash001009 [Apostasia shenzhenica]
MDAVMNALCWVLCSSLISVEQRLKQACGLLILAVYSPLPRNDLEFSNHHGVNSHNSIFLHLSYVMWHDLFPILISKVSIATMVAKHSRHFLIFSYAT